MNRMTLKKIGKRILCLVTSLVTILAVMPAFTITADAATATNSLGHTYEISNPTYYASGCLKSLTLYFKSGQAGLATSYAKLGFYSTTPAYNWYNMYVEFDYDTVDKSWPDTATLQSMEAAQDVTLYGLSDSEFEWTKTVNGETVAFTGEVTFADGAIPCNANVTYYVYKVCRTEAYGVYPDGEVLTTFETKSDGSLTFNGGSPVVTYTDLADGETLTITNTFTSATVRTAKEPSNTEDVKIADFSSDYVSSYIDAGRITTSNPTKLTVIYCDGTSDYTADGTAITGRHVCSASTKGLWITTAAAHNHDGEGFVSKITTADELQSLFTDGGSGYLANDITLTSQLRINSGTSVSLCLNGYVIKQTATVNAEGGVINSEGDLDIYDCGTSSIHYFKVGDNGVWNLTDDSSGAVAFDSLTDLPAKDTVISLTGGCITGGVSRGNGGGIWERGAALTLHGGNIVGNYTDGDNYWGGGIEICNNGYYSSGTLYVLCGARIVGNHSGCGGGAINNDSNVVVDGGVIAFNYSTADLDSNPDYFSGAGIRTCGDSSTIKITGTSKIYGNYNKNEKYNVFLTNDWGTDLPCIDFDGGLNSGANVWLYTYPVATATADALVGCNATKDSIQYMHSDNNDTADVLFCDGTKDWLADGTEVTNAHHTHQANTVWMSVSAVHSHDGKAFNTKVSTEAELVAALNLTSSGAIYSSAKNDSNTYNIVLTKDITLSKALYIGESGGSSPVTVNICLNGHVLDFTGVSEAIRVCKKATLNLYDCDTTTKHYFSKDSDTGRYTLVKDSTTTDYFVTGGVVTNSGSGSVIIYMDNQSTSNLYGGNIAGGYNSSGAGGGVYNYHGTFTMSGGAITYNMTGGSGGGVYSEGTITMSGGAISYNTSGTGGGGILNFGTVTMSACTINNNVAKWYGGGVNNNSSGTIIMNNCTISSNSTITYHGGGAYNQGSFTVNNSVISDNTSNGLAGGIYNDSTGTLTMNSSTVSGNQSKSGGGGIDNKGNFIMNGGTITGNKSTGTDYGGGVYYELASSSMTIGGNAVISGNYDKAVENNLYLAKDKTVAISTTTLLTLGAKIGITTNIKPTEATPVAITGTNDADYSSYFTSDNQSYSVYNDSNVVKLMKVIHTHNWAYISSGATIVATCSGVGVCDYTGTDTALTLVAPTSLTYDGTAKTVSIQEASIAGQSSLPTVKYYDGATELSAAPTNAGTYTAKISIGEAVASVEFTVTTKAVTVAADDLSKTYGAADPTLTATADGLVGSDTVSYSVTRASGEDVGDYTVTASGAALQGNYAVSYVTGKFTINKASTLTVSGINYSGTYDGTAHGDAAASNVTAGTTISYSTDGGTTWSTTVPTITNVGTATVQVKAANSNYDDATGSYTLTVSPKTVTVSGITAEDRVYSSGDTSVTLVTTGASFAGKVTGDVLTVSAVGTMTDDAAGTGKAVSISNIVLSGTDAANYVLAASGNQESTTVNIANASQASPSGIGKTDETIKEKADGTITGVTSEMEYKLSSDTTYTAISGTTVENLADGTYDVRYAAKANYNASEAVQVTIAEGAGLTVSFDENGGSDVADISGLSWQQTVTVPSTTRTGYEFAEWNTSASGSGSKLEDTTETIENITYTAIWTPITYAVTFNANGGNGEMTSEAMVYDQSRALAANVFTKAGFYFKGWAKSASGAADYSDSMNVKNLSSTSGAAVELFAVWEAKPVYSINGMVQQSTSSVPLNVSGASVVLRKGTAVIAETTSDADGNYSFTGVESGEYDIVVTGHATGDRDNTKTTFVEVVDANKSGVNVLLPMGYVSSELVINAGTPDVVVQGLDDEAAAQSSSIGASDVLKVVLTVESKSDVTNNPSDPDYAAQTAIKQAAGSKQVDFINMDVTKYINATSSAIHETGDVLETIITYTTAGRQDFSVYRFHDADGNGVSDDGIIELTKLDTRPTGTFTDGTFYVGDGYISIYSKKYSVFTIAYNNIDYSDDVIAVLPGSEDYCPQDSTCVYAKFTDADPKAWYHDGVHFCVEKTYMRGIGDDLFDPEGTLSRAMIVTMLWRMENSPSVDYAMSFEDVADNQWYTEAIRWAESTGVVNGYDANTFGPNDDVTREQLAAVFYRYASYKGIDVSARNDLSKFADASDISSWAVENMKWANASGMVNGRTETTIVPLDNATRAEAANMFQRFCRKVLRMN